jgi:hypothetical protein
MFSVFLCPQRRHVSSTELSQSEGESFFKQRRQQRASSLYVHRKSRSSFEQAIADERLRIPLSGPTFGSGSQQQPSATLHFQKIPTAEHVLGERTRASENEPGDRGISLPSVPYSDAKNASNGMIAFPGSPAQATSPRMQCGKQR